MYLLKYFCAVVALLIFITFSVAAQGDDAKNKEIDRLFDAGYAKIFEKDFAGAVEDFKKAVALDPSVSNSHFNLGRAYIANNEPDKGLAEFEKYRQIFTDEDEGADAWVAEAYFRKGEAERALDYINGKLTNNEKSSVLLTKRAEIYAALGKIDESIADYSIAIEHYDAPGLLFARAELYKKKGSKQLAAKDLISILKNSPDDEKLRVAAVSLGASENDLPKRFVPQTEKPNAQAKELFQKAFDGLIADGKDAGLYHFEKVAKADPTYAAPFFYLGSIYESQVLSGSAIRNYEKAEIADPTFVQAFLKHADILKVNGHGDKAIFLYDKALKIDPRFSPAFLGRGIVYDDQAYEENRKLAKAGLENKALVEYNKAIQFDPKNASAYYRRGGLYTRQQQYELAVKDLTDALAFNTADFMTSSYYLARAEALCRSGKKDQAKADEKKATDLGGFTNEPCK